MSIVNKDVLKHIHTLKVGFEFDFSPDGNITINFDELTSRTTADEWEKVKHELDEVIQSLVKSRILEIHKEIVSVKEQYIALETEEVDTIIPRCREKVQEFFDDFQKRKIEQAEQ